ncbi:hypothetical protein CYMTET_54125 [Cymbomonas tetramitiformis]|uniref:Uncharacterized protein n=1 Tax=Cymbomonas tetramitiformis TaxID=36881 RepID=A0AAE0BFW7_9CHLO|nr:hypothetical protein CYMTET_54125 [Cymbomonas tetramitiformis]
MDRAWEDRIEETEDDATRAGHGCGMQGSGGTQTEQSGQASDASGPSPAASSQHLIVQDILAEGDDLSSPSTEHGVWTQEQGQASPKRAMSLAEERVADLMGEHRLGGG